MNKLHLLLTLLISSVATAYVPGHPEMVGLYINPLPVERTDVNVGSVTANFLNAKSVAQLKLALEALDDAAAELGKAIANNIDLKGADKKCRTLSSVALYFGSTQVGSISEFVDGVSRKDELALQEEILSIINKFAAPELVKKPQSFLRAPVPESVEANLKKALLHFEQCTELRYQWQTAPLICRLGGENAVVEPIILSHLNLAFKAATKEQNYRRGLVAIFNAEKGGGVWPQAIHAYTFLMDSLAAPCMFVDKASHEAIKALQKEIDTNSFRPLIVMLDQMQKSLKSRWYIDMHDHPMVKTPRKK